MRRTLRSFVARSPARVLLTLLAVFTIAAPSYAQWTLVGITGDGALPGPGETLFEIELSGARNRIIQDFASPQGGDGEALAYNPTDGLLYRGSGNDGTRDFVSLNLTTGASTDIGITGDTAANEEFTALAYDPVAGDFVVAVRGGNFLRRITTGGAETNNFPMTALIHGMGFLDGTLYGVSTNGDALLREINPADGTFVETALNVPGADTGFTAMAIHPDTGMAYGVTRDAGRESRRLVVFDPTTGEGSDVGLIGNGIAAVAFIPSTSDILNDLAPFPFEISVDRGTGEVVMFNPNDAPVSVKGYSIRSADGSLNENNFTPFSASDSDWIQLTADGASSDVSEGHLTTGSIPAGATSLGNVWEKYYLDEVSDGDMTFEIIDENGAVLSQPVIFNGPSYDFLDLTYDGNIDIDDWVDFTAELGVTDLAGLSTAQAYNASDLNDDGLHDIRDVLTFRLAYDAANGAGAFASQIGGGGVPEPSTFLLLGLVGLLAVNARRLGATAVRAAVVAVAAVCFAGPALAVPLFLEDFEGLSLMDSDLASDNDDETDWTNVGPAGWTSDDRTTPNEPTRPEFQGWVYADHTWWLNQQGNQAGRVNFRPDLQPNNTIALVDPDAHDDFINNDPDLFSAVLRSPEIDISALSPNTLVVAFDSTWVPEDLQEAAFRAVFNDGASTTIEVFRWDSEPNENFKGAATNERVAEAINNPAGATTVQFEWDMVEAGNDWWWGIDNVEVIVPHTLEVNTSTGEMTLSGGSTAEIFSYEIKSADGSLNASGWEDGNLASQGIGSSGSFTGDFDKDDDVDGDDFLIWQSNFNQPGPFTSNEGDADGDSDVDGDDFLAWQSQFGSSTGPGEAWETLIATNGQLLEAFLLGSTEFSQGTSTSLGFGYDTAMNAQDLTFQFTTADGALINGLVQYVSGGGGANAIPEPATATMALCGLAAALAVSNRRRRIMRCPPLSAVLAGGLALVIAADASASRFVDRDYEMGDAATEGAAAGNDVGSGNGLGVTRDGAGELGMQQIIHLLPSSNTGTLPVYSTIAGRPDGGSGLGITFTGSDEQYLSGFRLGLPETSISSTNQGGTLDFTGISDRGMQFWVNPGAAAGPQTIVMDTNQHGVRINSDGNFSMRYNGADVASSVAATAGTWYHVMVLRDGGSGSVMYIDGNAAAARAGGYDGDDTASLVVGANTAGSETTQFDGGTEEFFTGTVDDLELFVLGSNDSTDYGTFNFLDDNTFAAFTLGGLAEADVNGDGNISGDGSGPAGSDDVTAFVGGWLNESRVNGILAGGIDTRLNGDLNFDGITDIRDWAILNAADPSMGAATARALQGVPEPGMMSLLALSAVSFLLVRKPLR